jgi:hypothetical protein
MFLKTEKTRRLRYSAMPGLLGIMNLLFSLTLQLKTPIRSPCFIDNIRYGGYGADTLPKGARVFHLNEHTNTIYSYVVNEMGERSQLLHFIEEEAIVYEDT